MLGIQQTQQSAVTQPLVGTINGGGVRQLLVAIATGVGELNGSHVPYRREKGGRGVRGVLGSGQRCRGGERVRGHVPSGRWDGDGDGVG